MKTNGEVDRNLRHHIFYVCLDAETNQVGNTEDGKTCANTRRYIALKFQYFHELPCKYHNYRDLC